MPLHPTWPDIALRLLLTMVAAAVIGIDRGVRGHAAGFRTTILVGLAAALAMIQANILLSVGGKTPTSFGEMDLMRLPLGILTGVGFIGGGTILRRGDLITGVTTAATLWAVTVIGLCFGGGQDILGIVGTGLAVLTLSGLRWLDRRLPREQHGSLVVLAEPKDGLPNSLTDLIAPLGFQATFEKQRRVGAERQTEFSFEILWKRAEIKGPPLELVTLLNQTYSVVMFKVAAEPR